MSPASTPLEVAQRLVSIKYTLAIVLAGVAYLITQPPFVIAAGLVAVGGVRSVSVIAAINAAREAGVLSEEQQRLVKRFARPVVLVGDTAMSALGTYAGALIAIIAAERLYGPWAIAVLAVLGVAVLSRNINRNREQRPAGLTVNPFTDPLFWGARTILTGFLAFYGGLFEAWAVCIAYGIIVRAIYLIADRKINEGFDALRVELTSTAR